MLECIEDIELYCASADIGSDQRTLDAVLRKLLTESSTYDQVRWRELAGFRNVVVHDYLGIRVERIRPIVREDIPKLKGADSRHTGGNRDQTLTACGKPTPCGLGSMLIPQGCDREEVPSAAGGR
jgi:uncharacterized protein with HEPN domain